MKKIKKIKFKFKINVIKFVYLLAIIIFLAILISFSLFLYNSFYRSFVQISDIYELQNRVSLETVDVEKFDKIKNNVEDKQNLPFPNLESIRNPFE